MHLYPYRTREMTEVGYRSGKVVVCTRFERENGRKPDTGEGKGRSVPDPSRKMGGNRVQEKEKSDLYPIGAGNRTETGYRSKEMVICTRLILREVSYLYYEAL